MTSQSTFMKLREDEREVRKKLIISAAMKLFETKKFHEIGMRDIANAAGVSVATIYRYFNSRDDLFVEALIQQMQDIKNEFDLRTRFGKASVEELALSIVDYLIENESTFQMMSHFMTRGEISSETLSRYNTIQRYFMGVFDQVLTRDQENENVRLFSHTFFSSLAGIVMTFRNYPGRNPEEVTRHIRRMAMLLADVFKNGMVGSQRESLDLNEIWIDKDQ